MKRDKNIYFLDSEGWLSDDHLATADGIHPTDLGFMRMLEHMEPAIKKILKKYGIT
jgi:lysophospholipase L1-like esterase